MRRELTPFSGQCPIKIYGELAFRDNETMEMSFELSGEVKEVLYPLKGPNKRKHELWTQTCFEAFFFKEDETYIEWNFNNHGSWQAYHFSGYREPAPPIELTTAPPKIEFENDRINIEIPQIDFISFNLTSIIKLKSGESFYFALVHSRVNADFHQREASLGRELALI